MSKFITFKTRDLNMAAIRVDDIEIVREKTKGSSNAWRKYVEIQHKDSIFVIDEPFEEVMKKIIDAGGGWE
ncbi:hypothetical protein [Bacillus atrophaeus]|uniref:hypothetical protein n=1 Tax=Bacillus atrophaeus TaxID=1452 RepID=UPI003F59FC6B